MTSNDLMPLDGTDTTRQEVAFDASQPLALSITNSSGEIRVSGADRSDVLVVAQRTNGGDSEARIVVDATGNKISVHPNWQITNSLSDLARKVKQQLKDGFKPEEWDLKNLRLGVNAKFDIQIEVPKGLATGSTISVKTASGDIAISDVSGRVSAATANGDVHMARIDGTVSTHSASGDLHLGEITGSMEANTANGDIQVEGGDAWTALRAVNGDVKVRNVAMRNARVTTVSGDISIDGTFNNRADYGFDTVSGDISLKTLLPDAGASLSFKAVSGDAKVEGDWTAGSGKRSWTLRGNGDGPKITVKAVSGDLRANGIISGDVTLREETPPRAEEKDEPTAADEATSDADIDFNVTRAKDWVTTITQKISQVVSDLDEAGDRHRSHRGGQTPPAPPKPQGSVPPVPPVPPVVPERPETPDVPDREAAAADTAPIATPPAYSDTAPFPASAPATGPDAPETQSQKRLRLLEAVQRGEMTVDEALAQLDANGNGSA
jgi:hypothetical protein